MKKRTVGIFVFDNAEVLDFAGPFEVFAVTNELNNFELFDVFTVAKTTETISAVNGLKIKPHCGFDDHPAIDVLILAGGVGTRKLLHDESTLAWIRKQIDGAQLTLSICSGARLLAKLGYLDGKEYCTHHEVYDHVKELAPTGIPQPHLRFVKTSELLYTSGGISAGIDLSFHVVEELLGTTTANETARYMEYTRIRQTSHV